MDFQEEEAAFAEAALSVHSSAYLADQVLLSFVFVLKREMTQNKE